LVHSARVSMTTLVARAPTAIDFNMVVQGGGGRDGQTGITRLWYFDLSIDNKPTIGEIK
jgi:hypothetical protein